MASNKEMASPCSKKRRVDSLSEFVISAREDLDTQITSCLYHLGKKDVQQATSSQEKIRRFTKANHAKYALQLKKINLEISALKQKMDGLEKREKFQSRQIATLQSKVDYFKIFISFDEEFDQDESFDTSQGSQGPQDSQRSLLQGSQDSQSASGQQDSQNSSETPETFAQAKML